MRFQHTEDYILFVFENDEKKEFEKIYNKKEKRFFMQYPNISLWKNKNEELEGIKVWKIEDILKKKEKIMKKILLLILVNLILFFGCKSTNIKETQHYGDADFILVLQEIDDVELNYSLLEDESGERNILIFAEIDGDKLLYSFNKYQLAELIKVDEEPIRNFATKLLKQLTEDIK